MDKLKKIFSFCFIMLGPVIFILLFGFTTKLSDFIFGTTSKPFFLSDIPLYMIFGLLAAVLGIQKHSRMNLLANIIGLSIIILMFAYDILQDFNIIREIKLFTFAQIGFMNILEFALLSGVYIFNIIRMNHS